MIPVLWIVNVRTGEKNIESVFTELTVMWRGLYRLKNDLFYQKPVWNFLRGKIDSKEVEIMAHKLWEGAWVAKDMSNFQTA